MPNTKYFQKILENLSELLQTVDLGQDLFNEAVEYFDILDSKTSTYEEKHQACIFVENLISRTKDFPRYGNSVNR